MLGPLSAGTHTIHFIAHRKADTTAENDAFLERVLDVTYVLTVQ